MKTIVAILMLLVASTVTAHNKVVVVPLGDGLPPCLISGKGIQCIATGKVRVLINKTINCSDSFVSVKNIEYVDNGEIVIFVLDVDNSPYIRIRQIPIRV